MPDNAPFSVHDALFKIFTSGGTGHNASPDSPSESLGAGEASTPPPPLKPMDPADLRMMLDDGPRAYNDFDERAVFEEIARLEAVTPPDPDPALDEWFDEREAEAREAMDNDPELKN